MNYFEEGKSKKKLFNAYYVGFDNKYKIDRYLEELKSKSEQQKSDFIDGLLTGSRSGSLFNITKKIAEDNPKLWGIIINHFNKIHKGRKKTPWGREFVTDLVWHNHEDFNLNEEDVHLLVPMVLSHNGKGDGGWILYSFKEKQPDKFKKYEKYLKIEIINYAKKLNPNHSGTIIDAFPDGKFYKELVDVVPNKTKNVIAERVFSQVLYSLNDELKNFDVEILNYFMDNFPESFVKDERNAATNMHNFLFDSNRYGLNEGSGSGLIKIFEKLDLTVEEKKKRYLEFLLKLNLESLKPLLYELTEDDQYLPQEVRDIFIF